MAEREEQIKQFCEVTGEPEDRAKFFLEASGWNLQVSNGALFRVDCAQFDIQVAQDTFYDQSNSKVMIM